MRHLIVIGAVLGVSATAQARPQGFVEGTFGFSYAVGTEGYSEDHAGATLQGGVRGGVWLWHLGRGERVVKHYALEVGFDRTSFGAGYSYYHMVTAPDGTVYTSRVDPSYERMRLLVGTRVAMPMHALADLMLRAAVGLDRVTGDPEVSETSPCIEVGLGFVFHLGAIRLGVEGDIPMAFHGNEHASDGIGPQFGHQPGFDRAIDFIGLVTAGAVF